jgi:transposase
VNSKSAGPFKDHPAGSKQTRAFLAALSNRFEFTFTPKHGSCLNLIESFFAKIAKTLLRGIRVASADELKARIELYLKQVNETSVVFRWKYKLETWITRRSRDYAILFAKCSYL